MVDREGNSYSKVAILGWLDWSGVSPITGTPLAVSDLRPNLSLAAAIRRLDTSSTALLTPPPDSPKFKFQPVHTTCSPVSDDSGLQPCGVPSCLWCPQCALFCFCETCPPRLWPLDIYNSVFHNDGKTFDHCMRVRAGFFFYANGAWQDYEMFYNLMYPRLSASVSKRCMEQLFKRMAAVGEGEDASRYTTQDCNVGGDRVCLDGRLAGMTKHTPLLARKMSLWERYIYEITSAGCNMPSYESARAYFSPEQPLSDPRRFCHIYTN